MNKNKLYLIGLLIVVFTATSCHDDLLNPVPESILTTANAFKTENDIDLAVLGIYNRYQARVSSDFVIMETPSDNEYAYSLASAVFPGMAEIDVLEISPENTLVNDFWKNTYNGIFRANVVLANIDIPTDYSASKKDQLIGEAKFLRSKFYFDLVRIFGGVPEVTSVLSVEEAKEIPRATEQEIYNLIVEDLQDAINKLPNPNSIEQGRASQAAAIALLAKVYVYLEEWNEAKIHLERLINDYDYSLVENYADLFKIETENNSETIFSLTFVEGSNGHRLTHLLTPSGGVYETITNGSMVSRPTWDLHKAYMDGDTRFEVTITEEQIPFASEPDDPAIWFPYFNKWIVADQIINSSGLDIPVLRLGDMILLYSEVLYNLGEHQQSLDQINRITERAFGDISNNYDLADISDAEAFYDILLLERRLELVLENNRWFDLVRTGRFTSVLTEIEGEYNPSTGEANTITINAQPYMRYFPIPHEQIQLASPNVLEQNEGY